MQNVAYFGKAGAWIVNDINKKLGSRIKLMKVGRTGLTFIPYFSSVPCVAVFWAIFCQFKIFVLRRTLSQCFGWITCLKKNAVANNKSLNFGCR